tara:strand:+ start:258 stop:1142 length:885 start_codon:yes stop_codon:yes gene_type:complete
LKIDTIIEINNLYKKFGDLQVLNNISFSIPKNSIFGILGPNGSGKSTLMRIFAKLIKNWNGEILFKNNSIINSDNHLMKMGFIIESPSFYEYLSAEKNLQIFARLTNTNQKKIDELFELVNLNDRKNSKVSEYSYGMKQRLGIAQAMLHNPDFLILDEPNNGLDPVGINQMADILFKLKQMGKTICISTHLLGEVDRMCTDVAILNKGKLIVSGNLNELTRKKLFYRLEVNNSSTALNDLKKIKNIEIIYYLENSILISQKKEGEPIDEVLISERIKSVKSLTKESSLVEYFYD